MQRIFLSLFLGLLLAVSAVAQEIIPLEETYSPQFSADELNRFLVDWPKFVEWAKDNGEEEIIYPSEMEKPNARFSKNVLQWVEKRKWTIDRFLYLERRINLALRAVAIKEEKAPVVSLLEIQIRDMENRDSKSLLIEGLKDELKLAKKAPYTNGITEEEITLITPYRSMFEKVLSGKPLVEKKWWQFWK